MKQIKKMPKPNIRLKLIGTDQEKSPYEKDSLYRDRMTGRYYLRRERWAGFFVDFVDQSEFYLLTREEAGNIREKNSFYLAE